MRRGLANDPKYRDAQRLRNYWRSRQAEENIRRRPTINRRMLLRVLAFMIVVYALLTAALVLLD